MRRLIAAVVLLAAGCAAPAADGPSAGPVRVAEGGDVEITVTPLSLGGGGAVFRVAFDTHTVELGFDPVAVSRLETPAGVVPADSWEGDGPGGHHREGELRFPTDARLGDLQLRIDVDEPVVVDWKSGA